MDGVVARDLEPNGMSGFYSLRRGRSLLLSLLSILSLPHVPLLTFSLASSLLPAPNGMRADIGLPVTLRWWFCVPLLFITLAIGITFEILVWKYPDGLF